LSLQEPELHSYDLSGCGAENVLRRHWKFDKKLLPLIPRFKIPPGAKGQQHVSCNAGSYLPGSTASSTIRP